jgi:hypothetical protein
MCWSLVSDRLPLQRHSYTVDPLQQHSYTTTTPCVPPPLTDCNTCQDPDYIGVDSGISTRWQAVTGTLVLQGQATAAAYQTLISGITFKTT